MGEMLRLKRLHPAAVEPRFASADAAGLDLVAALDAPIEIPSQQWRMIPTGWAMALPKGFEGQVRPRSGLAARHGITVLNSPGTIDADYRGEVKVVLINHGPEAFVVKAGERIAQLVIAPVVQMPIRCCDELDETERGEGGFGSTGR